MGAGLFIILLLTSVLFGSESAFIYAGAKADVKEYVIDKDRQAELLKLMKDYEKDYKIGRKKEKKQEKELEDLFTLHTTKLSEFQSVFDAYKKSRDLRQLSYVKSVLKTKSIVTETEWTNMLSRIDKVIKSQLDQQERLVERVESANENLEAELKEWIEEEERANQAASIMKEVNSSEIAILKKLFAFNYKENELLRNRLSTEEEYKKAFKEYNDLWQDYFDLYTSAHLKLSSVTTDDEWKKMKKYAKSLF